MGKISKSRIFRWLALAIIIVGILAFMVLDNRRDPGMTIVAKIDRNPIYLFELQRELMNYYNQIGGTQQITDDNLDELRVSVMDVLVEQKIVLLDAEEKGYIPNSAEIDTAIETQMAEATSEAEWEAFLLSWGFTAESFRKYMGDMYTVDNYPPTQWNIPVITEEQILAEYEKRVKESPALVYDEAKEYLRTTLEINVELEVSQAWFKQLKDNSTIAVLDKRVLGRKAFAEEKYDEAVKLYLKAMKSEPKDPYIDVSIAKAYAKLGDTKNMQKYFDSAVEKDGKNSFIHMAKAKILLESADEAGATEEIVKAVAVVDKTNLALLERIEELALQLNMEDEANQLDKMIRAIMMPESLSTQP